MDYIEAVNEAVGEWGGFGAVKETLLRDMDAKVTELHEKLVAASTCREEREEAGRNALERAKMVAQDLGNQGHALRSQASQLLAAAAPTADTLTNCFKKLEVLEAAKGYTEALAQIEDLSEEIRKASRGGQFAAPLQAYIALARLSRRIQGSALEGLASHASMKQKAAFDLLEEQLTRKFNESLEEIGWPTPRHLLPPEKQHEHRFKRFQVAFKELLELQQPEDNLDAQGRLPPLLPFTLLLKPLSKRFRFHFETKRETNRIDKPEWMFAFILNNLRDHIPFLIHWVGPLFANLPQVDAKVEFTRHLLTLVERKLKRDVPVSLKDPTLFGHLVSEATSFEQCLREIFSYPPDLPACLHILTDNPRLFEDWLEFEKNFSVKRLEEIVSDRDAWNFVNHELKALEGVHLLARDTQAAEQDSNLDETAKITVSADSFIALLDSVTSLYEHLPNPHHQLRFFDKVQRTLIRYYLDELKEQKRNLKEVDFDTSQACRVVCSATYCIRRFAEWDMFNKNFHRMWRCMEEDAEDGAPLSEDQRRFKNMLGEYAFEMGVLRGELMDLIQEQALKEFNRVFRPYVKMRTFSTRRVEAELEYLEISPEICPSLTFLRNLMLVLHENLFMRQFEDLRISLAGRISNMIVGSCVSRRQFDAVGALQFRCDMGALFSIYAPYSQSPENNFQSLKAALAELSREERLLRH